MNHLVCRLVSALFFSFLVVLISATIKLHIDDACTPELASEQEAVTAAKALLARERAPFGQYDQALQTEFVTRLNSDPRCCKAKSVFLLDSFFHHVGR